MYDRKVKGFKERDNVGIASEKVTKNLDFAQNGNFVRASSNWENYE